MKKVIVVKVDTVHNLPENYPSYVLMSSCPHFGLIPSRIHDQGKCDETLLEVYRHKLPGHIYNWRTYARIT